MKIKYLLNSLNFQQALTIKHFIMKKQLLIVILFSITCLNSFSQVNSTIVISGKITDKISNDGIPASVILKNTGKGVSADAKGVFRIPVSSLPVTLVISAMGYEQQELLVNNTNEINIGLVATITEIGEVFVTAPSKLKTKLISTPVSIEIVGKTELINSPAESYWATILGKKGLDVTTSGLLYKTFSTRGFNGSGSSRVNQFMDGMDNQAPGLNFSVGNFVGLTELDVESIEILPGASSALYGSGGMNGTILVNSKNPFTSPGLSIEVKQGLMDIGKKQRGTVNGFNDYALRYAKQIGEHFAFKVGVQYVQAKDWLANDSTNYFRYGSSGNVIPGTRQSDPNYDGVNVYGDETKVDIRGFMTSSQQLQTIFANYLSTPQFVSRTGYPEIAAIDPKTKNLKLSGALHYKFNNNLEAIFAGHWGTGNTVYTGNNRYSFKDVKIGQYKLELNSKNWFVRGYTTQEDAGEAYSATVASQYLNEAWKRSFNPANINSSWYPQYFGAFATGAGQIFQTVLGSGGTLAQAQSAVFAAASQLHTAGRAFADIGRPVAGSTQFKQIFDQVRKIPIPNGGLFLDQSQLWMLEGQYSFADKIKFAEVIVGGNIKNYILNSHGTIFIDTAGALKINEWGGYAQITKKLLKDKLTLSASGRFDKNENFKGKLTPRVTALFEVAKNHNIRVSYQTAYRFPTTQNQWIKLDIGNAILLGGLPWIKDYMKTESNATFIINPATGQTTPYIYKEFKPESIGSFELGYKSLINKKLLIDAYVYFGQYTNFLGRILLIQPPNVVNKPFSIVVNSETKVKTWGMGIGFDYKLQKNYFLFLNTYTDNLTNVASGFDAGFNTPKYRVNAGFGNNGLGKQKNIGFNINFRWQDSFKWEGAGFADGIVKKYTTLDAQVNYKLPKIKSMIKLGGTNITNKFYQNGFGNPYIGGMYYISFGYHIL